MLTFVQFSGPTYRGMCSHTPSMFRHPKYSGVSSDNQSRNAEKYFRMWIGDTNGSKSVYQKMIRTMLGDYYCDLPATYFSAEQRGGSGPTGIFSTAVAERANR